jgi:hypothetical protein
VLDPTITVSPDSFGTSYVDPIVALQETPYTWTWTDSHRDDGATSQLIAGQMGLRAEFAEDVT